MPIDEEEESQATVERILAMTDKAGARIAAANVSLIRDAQTQHYTAVLSVADGKGVTRLQALRALEVRVTKMVAS